MRDVRRQTTDGRRQMADETLRCRESAFRIPHSAIVLGCWLALIAVLCLAVPAAGATLKGIGAHRGIDLYTLDGGTEEFLLRDGTSVRLTVAGIDRPELFGGHLHIAPWPLFDVELNVEGVKKKYGFTFERPGEDPIESEAEFARLGAYASIRRSLFRFPSGVKSVMLYAGAGLGAHFIRARLSEKTVSEGVSTASARFDLDELTEYTFGASGHGLVGLSLRPWLIPFSVYADLTHFKMGNSPVEKLEAFNTLHIGLSLSF